VLLDNPHLTSQEKKLKSEARNIFIKEISKNIGEQGNNMKFVSWPRLKLIFNIGSLWLISEVLTEEDKVENSTEDKKLEPLV
jgi:hypothetical protein